MIQDVKPKNWAVVNNAKWLHEIHESDINVAILKRDIKVFNREISLLVSETTKIELHGSVEVLISKLKNKLKEYKLISKDIISLLLNFKEITRATSFKLLLTTVDTNMCRKFHIDNITLRLLCTYFGPGTLWLPEDSINRKALNGVSNNNAIVINENNTQQVKTGDVLLLKGQKYCATSNAVMHKSPIIEGHGLKRLLLRIDTNDFLNF